MTYLGVLTKLTRRFLSLNEPSTESLLGILRISDKYGIRNTRVWSIRQLRTRFPVDPDHLYDKTHFEKLRQGGTAVELTNTSRLCNTPEFFPYAYYAIATSDWRDQKALLALGWDKLGPYQTLQIASARAFLQSKFTEALLIDAP